jgi:hypothetical protein
VGFHHEIRSLKIGKEFCEYDRFYPQNHGEDT